MRPLLLAAALAAAQFAHADPALLKPVTPDAMPETVALYTLLQRASGRYTLTGQHNPPLSGGQNSAFAAAYTGKTPAVWTGDFGFAKDGDLDAVSRRPETVREAIRQHRMGSIVSLCWHAVPPTADEPVVFAAPPGSDPNQPLRSVEGRLSEAQFHDVLTPGTALHARWEAQVDAIAGFLRQLQDAHVPVIWRPYHEMNGDWFWWGGRSVGPDTTPALYRRIFDRFVHHHRLRNLLWLWSTDRFHNEGMLPARFWPGDAYVDLLGLDVYQNDFAQTYYDHLLPLARGRPLALAEVGNPPAPEIMAVQPGWVYYAIWTAMVRNTPRRQYAAIFTSRMLGRDDPAYADLTAPYREACGLPHLTGSSGPAPVEGSWRLNEDDSTFGPTGPGYSAVRLTVTAASAGLLVRSTLIREYAPDEISESRYPLDGTWASSEGLRMTRRVTAHWTEGHAALLVQAEAARPNGRMVHSDEIWTTTHAGTRLVIQRSSDGPPGAPKSVQTLVYDRDER